MFAILRTFLLQTMQNIRIYIDKLILISCILVSVCIIAFHLSYGFEDIGVRLQEILNKAKKSALEPILESSKLSSLQKSMFVKSGFTMSKEQLELGKILYFDPRLSGDKRHSCNTCHNLALAGTSYIDNSSANPQKLNAPTLYNAIFNDVAYYRGAISRLDKADKNTTNFLSKNVLARASLHALSASNEMNANVDKMIAMIANSDEYMAYFKRAFGSKVKVNADLISQSLAGFIMSLNTFSRYDDFLMGNLRALSLEEAQGLELFIDKGCVACHNGINLGGTMQPFEVMRKYQFSNIGGLQSDADKMLKVSSLRNITLSAPYFHNGGFEKLEDAIKEMGQMQLGIDLSNKEIKQLILFLETLRGNLDSINLPNLPRM